MPDNAKILKALIAEAVEENNEKLINTIKENVKKAREAKKLDPEAKTDLLDGFFDE